MNTLRLCLNQFVQIGLLLTLGADMSAQAAPFGIGVDSWREEVLLHDGGKLIVKRSQSYGGRSEIGQPPPIKEHTISFSLPGTSKEFSWTSEYGEDLGRTNFNLLAVHVLRERPYLVVEPNLCLSYNKWGRPNPPYVFFEHDGQTWKRISSKEFPAEFTSINVSLTLGRNDVKAMVGLGLVPSEGVKERNSRRMQPEYKSILRAPIDSAVKGCPELIRVEGGWVSPGGAKSPIPISPAISGIKK